MNTSVKFRSWKNVIREGVKNTGRNRVMSMASIGAIMAALFVLGVIIATIINLNNAVAELESKVEITIYMAKEASEEDIKEAKSKLNSWEGILEAKFIDKDQALEDWRKEMGDKSYL